MTSQTPNVTTVVARLDEAAASPVPYAGSLSMFLTTPETP
jgi:hypothetical protein